METVLFLTATALNLLLVPLLLTGFIRKTKAWMQGRIGSPVLQPFYDVAKLFRKSETISSTASWVFHVSPPLGLAIAVIVAAVTPWSGMGFPVGRPSGADLLLIVYLLGLAKFLAMLAALDTGSAFGGLGASREATVSLLAEPILLIGLAALCLGTGTTDLAATFRSPLDPLIAALVAPALAIAALAELSRMPVDDPTTHLELTMVHEALILENSGRNLAVTELAVALRSCVFLGLAVQTALRACSLYPSWSPFAQYGLGLAGLLGAGIALAVAEGVLVKLNWRRVPTFLGFGLAFSFLAALVAAVHR